MTYWLAALALALAVVPPQLLPFAVAGSFLAAWSPFLALTPLLFAIAHRTILAAERERRREVLRRQFSDFLLALSLSALDGYGVLTALLQAQDVVGPPLGEHVLSLAEDVRGGSDLDSALERFRKRVGLPAADRLVEAVHRERLFGLGLGDTLVRQLELLRVEEEGQRKRTASLLPYLFTISIGILFLEGGFVVFLPALISLLHGLSNA